MHPYHIESRKQNGVILLVVLSALTFFSILVAAYLVFSNQSRDASLALAKRSTRAPDVEWIMNEALMTLVRGTDDEFSPFYGEDLLSDYYGHDGLTLRVRDGVETASDKPNFKLDSDGTGIIRIPIQFAPPGASVNLRPSALRPLNDALAGRLITFVEGPLTNRTYRIVRSRFFKGITTKDGLPDGLPLNGECIYIDLCGNEEAPDAPLEDEEAPDAPLEDIAELFYKNNETPPYSKGYAAVVNGIPRNSMGVGIDQDGASKKTGRNQSFIVPDPDTGEDIESSGFGLNLEQALQPNHFGRLLSKKDETDGDFDEDYDAADFNNWWLSHRDEEDGEITIPSFHRPSVINYILNTPNATALAPGSRENLMVSLQRATFRPLPLFKGATPGGTINQRFTGGNSNYALRTPGPFRNEFYMQQLLAALIKPRDSDDNPSWDVDNDGDGKGDSIWVDLGLPTFVSPEGKLIRPLVAPMIEDLGARLNLNAHGTYQLNSINGQAGLPGNNGARWAGPNPAGENPTDLFRGLGWGPAEVTIGRRNGVAGTELNRLVLDRYRYGNEKQLSGVGLSGRDALDSLRFGFRPPKHTANGGFGYSTDPLGMTGTAIGLSGHLLMAPHLSLPNENIDNPYEQDPTGKLAGDTNYSFSDLEPLLRSNDFDSDLLPTGLRDRLQTLISNNYEYEHSFTAKSTSSDHPVSSLVDLIEDINGSTVTYNNAQVAALVAPELRLGRKLDVNRAIGNLFDDDSNGTIDEPLESETSAFPVFGGYPPNFPEDFKTTPDYLWDEKPPAAGEIPVDGRQLLARHLYVLLMALSRDLDSPARKSKLPSDLIKDADSDAYRARRLAQWAVNVVDYKDPDAIMTRFVFDPSPFDAEGWNPPEPPTSEVVVWGTEAPELLFSETLAFHDIRVRNTNKEAGPEPDEEKFSKKTDDHPDATDDNSDQVRVPQGSLFIELYNPRPAYKDEDLLQTTKPSLPAEFYNERGELILGAAAPKVGKPASPGAPIWRIAISEPHYHNGEFLPENNPSVIAQDIHYGDAASFDPTDPLEINSTAATRPGSLKLDRFIFFGSKPDRPGVKVGTAWDEFDDSDEIRSVYIDNIQDMRGKENSVFFASGSGSLEPGQFLVLGPRKTTYFGSQLNLAGESLPSEQKLILDGGSFVHQSSPTPKVTSDDQPRGSRRTPIFGEYYTKPKTLIVKSFLPTGWPSLAFAKNPDDAAVGLNVSEPLHNDYYTAIPTCRYRSGDDSPYPLQDAYHDLDNPNDVTHRPRDEPFDVNNAMGIDVGGILGDVLEDSVNDPKLGTFPQYCSAFLQRLANPLIPYHPETNPYRTVDWIPIDLTVFSGEANEKATGQENTEYAKRSRQRTGRSNNTLFSYETNQVDFTELRQIDAAGTSFFHLDSDAIIYNSLGFLNTATSLIDPNPLPPPNPPIPLPPDPKYAQRGSSNGPYSLQEDLRFKGFTEPLGKVGGDFTGLDHDRNLPATTYALHPWLNRPFASHLELMMVPACSAGRLFEEFAINDSDPDVYPSDSTDVDTNVALSRAPFPHLLNFFHSGKTANPSHEFSRIFDFVHTLPRFRGEVELISPSRNVPEISDLLKPPFNIAYDNQRQGTINLNTVSSKVAWYGLMQAHMNANEWLDGTGTKFDIKKLIDTRRGYVPTTSEVPFTNGGTDINYDSKRLNKDFPTQFAGVFRSATTGTKGITDRLNRSAVEAGLLRPEFSDPQLPFFVRNTDPSKPALNRWRNPFVRYQTLMRMPNLVSDNSQVFLIRMTMGFFEVDAASQHLGREYNAESGNAKRYRGTFVIDRSIPVGFSPGQDLNTRNTIIFESYDK